MPFTVQLFQITNCVKVLTFIFHSPFVPAHTEPTLCHWFEESLHNGCPWFHYLHLFRGIFQTRAWGTWKALQNIRQFWTILTFGLLESICFPEAGFPSGGKKGLKTTYPHRPWPGSLKQLLRNCLSCPYCIKTAAVHPRFSSVQGNLRGKLINTPIAHLILSPLLPPACVN